MLAINESTCKLSVGKVFYLKEIEEIGHVTERFTPFQKSVTKIRLVKTKKFQFEILFCHITTNEILHLNCVFGLRLITFLK